MKIYVNIGQSKVFLDLLVTLAKETGYSIYPNVATGYRSLNDHGPFYFYFEKTTKTFGYWGKVFPPQNGLIFLLPNALEKMLLDLGKKDFHYTGTLSDDKALGKEIRFEIKEEGYLLFSEKTDLLTKNNIKQINDGFAALEKYEQ